MCLFFQAFSGAVRDEDICLGYQDCFVREDYGCWSVFVNSSQVRLSVVNKFYVY